MGAVAILKTIPRENFVLRGSEVLMPMRDGEMEQIIRGGGGEFAFGTGGCALIVNDGQMDLAVQVARWRGLLFEEGDGI